MAQQDIQISVPIIGVDIAPVAYAEQILDRGTNMTLDEVAKKSVAYGPYASVAAAHTALSDVGLNTVGTTVGISGSNNTVVEYWYQGGTAQANLVKKQSDVTVDAYTKAESDNKYQPKGSYATQLQLDGKVDKEYGKSLSTNDYTNEEKQKVGNALVPADIAGKANVTDVYSKSETYNKTELNNMITTPDQEYVTVTATSQTTAVTDLLPATGAADTVYRVGCWNGTQYDDTCYSEYAWKGDAYVKLHTKNVGIDAEPTLGSNKLVESGGVKKDLLEFETVLYGEKEIYKTDIINPQSYPTGHVGNGYSVCKIPKDTTITKVALKAPAGTSPKLDFAKLENGTLYVLRRFSLNTPVDIVTDVETEINYTCTDNDVYAIISGGFVFEVLSTTTNLPYVVSDQYNTETGQYSSQQFGTKDLNYAIIIYGHGISKISENGLIETVEEIENKICGELQIEIDGFIQSGSIAPNGIVNNDTPSRILYYVNCEATKTITVSSGDLYGFFADIPQVGSVEINGTRYIENLSNTTLNIPETAKYLAVRAEIAPVFTGQYVGSELTEKSIKETEEKWMKFNSSDLSVIETMGCCGDSYTAGMIALGPPYAPSNVEYARPNLSWGKILERHFGIDVSVYAKGGMTVKTYLTDADCLPLLLSEPAKKLYAISLGHNDMYHGTTVGSISSLDGDWAHYPDNFIGNYGRIIEQIQEHAPNAFIVLMRQSRPYCLLNNGAELNQAISDLGVHYGIPVLNPEDDPYLSSNIWTDTMVRRHPVFAGYAGMAMAFARQFNAATIKYWEYFVKYGIN